MVEVVPELILWRRLQQLVDGNESEPLPWQKYLSRLPLQIELSEEFVQQWSAFAVYTVRQALLEKFAFRSFLCCENDECRWYSALDKEFWQNMQLEFSSRLVFRFWESIKSRSGQGTPDWILITPADAMLACMLDSRLRSNFSQEWLHKNKASWVVVSYFILTQTWENPESLPWKVWFDGPTAPELPLRALLLEYAAHFFALLNNSIQRFLGQDVPSVDLPLHVRFDSESVRWVHRIALQDVYQGSMVRNALQRWTSTDTVGFDDDQFLLGVASRYNLLGHLNDYEDVCRMVSETFAGTSGQEGEISNEQNVDDTSSSDIIFE